jgi:hypothetical protein
MNIETKLFEWNDDSPLGRFVRGARFPALAVDGYYTKTSRGMSNVLSTAAEKSLLAESDIVVFGLQ